MTPLRVEVVDGTDAALVAARLRALDAESRSPGSPGLLDVQVVPAGPGDGVAPLVLAAPGAPLAGADVILNWGHGVSRDDVVERLWHERIAPFAAGLRADAPAAPGSDAHPDRKPDHTPVERAVAAHRLLARVERALVEGGLDHGQLGYAVAASGPGLPLTLWVDPAAGGPALDRALLRCGFRRAEPVAEPPTEPPTKPADRPTSQPPRGAGDTVYFRPDPGAPAVVRVHDLAELADLAELGAATPPRPDSRLPRRTRHTARVLPVDPQGRVLLLHGVDPDDREHPLWFTLGGEIDPGEDPVTTALRELREEVGLVAAATDVLVLGEQAIAFPWGSVVFDQQQVLCAVRVSATDVDLSGQDAVERATIDEARWWEPAALARSAEPVGEGLLPWLERAVEAVGRPSASRATAHPGRVASGE